jgi:cytochrome P450
MTGVSEFDVLDPARLRALFDLTNSVYASRGGAFADDPYPAFHRLRETGPVHPGVVGPLVGFTGAGFFQGLPYPDRLHFSAFDWDTCDAVFRDGVTFVSRPPPEDGKSLMNASILYMDGTEHRRYRGLVQPSFLPKRSSWWTERWVVASIEALLDRLAPNGRGDLNVEFFAAIPLLTITGSFGVSVADALDIRAAVTSDGLGIETFMRILLPIVRARREEPQDDLISVLVQAEMTEEDGTTHRLTDEDVLTFSFILLAAGSGTTWKQMGITMLALLSHPQWLDAVKQDRAQLRPVVEESLRWMPTDPMFSRFVDADTELAGVAIPDGAVMHMCLAAANRDPARWERPDEFDPSRPLQSHMGFGNGAHICLGMHVARAEIVTAIGSLLDRFPNLRLDTDADSPRIVGMYERGPTSVPVRFD